MDKVKKAAEKGINAVLNKSELVLNTQKSIEVSGTILSCLGISSLKIERKINEHSVMRISGSIEQTSKALLNGKIGQDIRIKSFDVEGIKSDLLFAGIIEKIEIVNGTINSTFTIEAKSFSVLLDKKKRKRSFQDKKKSYGDLIKAVKDEGKYDKINFIVSEKSGKELADKLIIQYEESDWEFLKRVCSRLKTAIVSEDGKGNSEESGSGQNGGGKKWNIWFGLPDRGAKELFYEKAVTEVTGADNEEYLMIKTPEKFEIGDKLKYGGKVYVITQSDTIYAGNIIETEYVLTKEENIKIKSLYNTNIAGKSVMAEVVEVGTGENLTRVRVDFIFDEKTASLESKESGNTRAGWEKYWFKFATPYSGTNSGIYFMPELKDRLLVNFTNSNEDSSYAGESLRDTNTFKDKSTEVEHKRIKISTGQQVMLSKKLEKVMLIGNEDRTVFADVVKDHIRFVADGSEAILKKDTINFKVGESSIIITNEGIELKAGSSSIKLSKGGKVEVVGS